MCALGPACRPRERQRVVPPSPIALPKLVTGANLRAVGDRRRGYGTETARRTMARLKTLGVNCISILLEGRMRNLRDLDIETPDKRQLLDVQNALLDANAMGLATVLIPHLYLDDGAWRGHIQWSTADERARWWASYTAFIDIATQIAVSTSATGLSIGTELKGLSATPDTHRQMQRLTGRIRREYKGLITYNANWDEAENVAFWGVTDIAGVNGYYPLTPDPRSGAKQVAQRLSKLGRMAGREVLVLEVGYRSSPESHIRPWEWPEDIDQTTHQRAQKEAWEAVLDHWLHRDPIRGLLVWVIPTDPDDPASEPPHGFNPLNKAAENVIGTAFRRAHRRAATQRSP